MDSLFSLDMVIGNLIMLLWVLLFVIMAGLALLRLRMTMAGMLLAGGFALWAVKLLGLSIASPIVMHFAMDPIPWLITQSVVSTVLGLLAMLLVAAGFAALPSSLRKLAG